MAKHECGATWQRNAVQRIRNENRYCSSSVNVNFSPSQRVCGADNTHKYGEPVRLPFPSDRADQILKQTNADPSINSTACNLNSAKLMELVCYVACGQNLLPLLLLYSRAGALRKVRVKIRNASPALAIQ